MGAHDLDALWAYAAGTLEPASAAYLEEHLGACFECRERLGEIRSARRALSVAAARTPSVDWKRVDDEIGAAIAARMARLERRRLPWFWLFAAAALASVVVLLVVRPSPRPKPAVDGSPRESDIALTGALPAPARVTSAAGATLASTSEPLGAGAALAAGDSVRTGPKGQLSLVLPEGSDVKLGPSTEVALLRSKSDDVALKLSRGTIRAAAPRRPGRQLTVEAGAITVTVVGTEFAVASAESHVEVAVFSGRVMVETATGESLLVGAGERIRFDRATGRRMKRPAAPGRNGAQVHDETPPIPTAPAPAVGEKEIELSPEPVVNVTRRDELALDTERRFLDKAEGALKTGRCAHFLEGLESFLTNPDSSPVPELMERARYLRARCFDERLMPHEAEREYRRYLEEFPSGRWAREAREAIGD